MSSEIPPTTPVMQSIDLPELVNKSGNGSTVLNGSIDAIQRVKVKLSVRVGETEMTVGDLLSLQQAQVIKLDSAAEAPVDILLEGEVVARGHLVAVDDNFGVQITELPVAK